MTAQSEAVDAYVHLLKGYVQRVGYTPAFSEWSEWVVKESGTDEDFIVELTKAAGGYESVLSQLYQPKGGSENFTNTRSPGQDDALVAATPGQSGTSAVHRTQRATSQESVEQFTDRALDTRGDFSSSEDSKQPRLSYGQTERHPAYGSGRRNISGSGYQPDMTGKDTLGKFLTQWERERYTDKGISPGPTIPSPITGVPGERMEDEENEETEEELAERIVDETTKPTEPSPEFAPTQPTETTRHAMGTFPGEKRLTEHPSYTEFKKRKGR